MDIGVVNHILSTLLRYTPKAQGGLEEKDKLSPLNSSITS